MTSPTPIRDLTTHPLTDAETDAMVAAFLPKKRNTKHYKAIAKAAEKLAGERLTMLEAESDALIATRKAMFAADNRAGLAETDAFVARRVALVGWLLFALSLALVGWLVWG